MTPEHTAPTPTPRFATGTGTATQPAPPAARREQYAGIVSRLLALTIDAMLLALVVPAIGAGVPALWGSITGSIPRWLQIGAGVLAGLVPFAYFWLAWCTTGRGAGGALLGVSVRRADGSRLGTIRAGIRAFLGLLFAPIWLASMVLIAFDPRRRALHDVLLHTVVLRTGT